MNKRNLALQISKHPLIELLKKDRAISNNLIARLIVEELMLEKKDIIDKIDSMKSLEELEKYWNTLESGEKALGVVIREYEEKKKQLTAAQQGKKPEDIKGLIVNTLGEAVADQIVEKLISPVLNKVNVVAAGASTAGGPIGILARAAIGQLAQAGIEAAVKTACKSFVNSILSSFKSVNTINDKLGVLFGDELEKKISKPNTPLEEKKNLIIANALTIFKNFVNGGAQGQFGDAVKKTVVSTLGMEIDIPLVGAIPIGSVITKFLLGDKVASTIDTKYDTLQALEAKAEQQEKAKKQLEEKIAQLKQLLDNEELKNLYDIVKDSRENDYIDLPDILSEGPSGNLKKAKEALQKKQYQTAAQLIVNNLENAKKTLFKVAAELQKDPTKNREKFSQQVLTFKESYKTGLEIVSAINAEIENIKKEIDPEPTVEPTAEPTAEPTSEPTAEPEETENTNEKDPEPSEIPEEDKTEYVKASTNFQNEFYNQKYRIQQAKLIEDVIEAIEKIYDNPNKVAAFGRPPEEQQTVSEQQDTVEASKDELRNLRIDFRSLLSRVNKASKALNKFEELKKQGSAVTDVYKKKFIDLLKQIQGSIKRIHRDLQIIIGKRGEIKEAVDTSDVMKQWKEVQKKYNKAIASSAALRELIDGTQTSEDPDRIVEDTYTALSDLATHFPSVNPFAGSEAKTTGDMKKYKNSFENAVGKVKSDLQNVLSLIKNAQSGEDTLQLAMEGLVSFSGAIQSIFGVESEFSEVKVDKNTPAAEGQPEEIRVVEPYANSGILKLPPPTKLTDDQRDQLKDIVEDEDEDEIIQNAAQVFVGTKSMDTVIGSLSPVEKTIAATEVKVLAKDVEQPGNNNSEAFDRYMGSRVPESFRLDKEQKDALRFFKYFQSKQKNINEQDDGTVVGNKIAEDNSLLKIVNGFLDKHPSFTNTWNSIMQKTNAYDEEVTKEFLNYLKEPIKFSQARPAGTTINKSPSVGDDKEDSKPSLEEMIKFLNDKRDDIVLRPEDKRENYIITKIEVGDTVGFGDNSDITYRRGDKSEDLLTVSKDSIKALYKLYTAEDDRYKSYINITNPKGKNLPFSFKLIKPLNGFEEDPETTLSERIEKLIKPLIKEMLTKGK